MHGGGGGSLCDINCGMGDLVVGAIGQAQWVGRLSHGGEFVFFLMSHASFSG